MKQSPPLLALPAGSEASIQGQKNLSGSAPHTLLQAEVGGHTYSVHLGLHLCLPSFLHFELGL